MNLLKQFRSRWSLHSTGDYTCYFLGETYYVHHSIFYDDNSVLALLEEMRRIMFPPIEDYPPWY